MPDRKEFTEILILKEKHGTSYYWLAQPEDRARAALTVLRDRSGYGWYYEPEPPDPLAPDEQALVGLTPEQIEALPESIKQSTVSKRDRLLRSLKAQQKRYDDQMVWWTRYRQVMDAPEEEAIQMKVDEGTKFERSLAWWLLEDREDYEYEGFEVEQVRRP